MFLLRVLVVVLCLAISHVIVFPSTVSAQENFGQSLKNLPPDQRKQKRQQYFSNLPEPQQKRLRENQQKFQGLPGDRKRALCQQFQSPEWLHTARLPESSGEALINRGVNSRSLWGMLNRRYILSGTHILVIPAKAGIQCWSKEKTGITVPLFAMDTGMRRYTSALGFCDSLLRERIGVRGKKKLNPLAILNVSEIK